MLFPGQGIVKSGRFSDGSHELKREYLESATQAETNSNDNTLFL